MSAKAASANPEEQLTNGNLYLAIFAHQPQQWGLRGDPYLWTLIASRLVGTPDVTDAEAVVQVIHHTFSEITGHSVAIVGNFRLDGIPGKGMSAGMISGEAWRDQIIPMLRSRSEAYFEELSSH